MRNPFKSPAHTCTREAVAVDRPGSGLFSPGADMTTVLWRCPCGNVSSTTLAGRWTLEQIRGERGEPAAGNLVPASAGSREDASYGD